MKIYTYGIIDSHGNHDKVIDGYITGLESACVYTIHHLDIGIVVSEFSQQIRDINEDHILEYEQVIARLMEHFTVLPMRFLTIFDKKENVLNMMKEHYSDFKNNLNRLRNKVEFGIKVIWPGEKIRENIARDWTHDLPLPDNSPGKKFIKEKFKEYQIDKKFEEEAKNHINDIDNFLCEFASEKKLESLRSKNLLLSAYYLLDKEKQYDFRERFERLKEAGSNFNYLFSGPWPPYNFISINKKKTLLVQDLL